LTRDYVDDETLVMKSLWPIKTGAASDSILKHELLKIYESERTVYEFHLAAKITVPTKFRITASLACGVSFLCGNSLGIFKIIQEAPSSRDF